MTHDQPTRPPQSGKPSTERALTIQIDDDHRSTRRHLNVDNIVVLSVSRGALTSYGLVAIVGVAATVGFLLSRFGTLIGVIGFVAAGVAFSISLFVEDKLAIETTADSYSIGLSEWESMASAYLELKHDLRQLSASDTKAILLIAAIMGALAGIINLVFGVAIGLLSIVALYVYLPDEVECEQSFSVTTPTVGTNSIESEFLDMAPSPITIERNEETALRRYSYRYHFVPDNIVSISEAEVLHPARTVLWAATLITGLLALYFLVHFDLVNTLIFIMIGGLALVVSALLEDFVFVSVRSHGDTEMRFEMMPDDAEELVRLFSQRNVTTAVKH